MSKSWFLGLVGLFMVAFGVFGIRVVQEQITIDVHVHGFDLPSRLLTFGLLGFVVLLGIWSVVIVAVRWNDERALVPGFLVAYRNALHEFTKRKWLLVLAGYVASVNVLGALAGFAMQRYYLGNYADKVWLHDRFPDKALPFQGLTHIAILLKSLPSTIGGTLGSFLPHTGMNFSIAEGFVALSMLALFPWVNRRLASLQDRSSQGSAIEFFRKLMWPIGILLLIDAEGQFFLLQRMYSGMAASIASMPNQPYGGPGPDWLRLQFAMVPISEIFYIVVTALFVGGLAGSMRRSSSGDSVTAESFLEDSIRTFKPMAGIFLLLGIIGMLFQFFVVPMRGGSYDHNLPFEQYLRWLSPAWSLLMLILMFAPYAVADGALSVWRGLRESFGIWLNCGYNLLSFMAFGIAMMTVILAGSSLLYLLAKDVASPLNYVPSLIIIVIRVVVHIVMAVAVWELFQQIKAASVAEPDGV